MKEINIKIKDGKLIVQSTNPASNLSAFTEPNLEYLSIIGVAWQKAIEKSINQIRDKVQKAIPQHSMNKPIQAGTHEGQKASTADILFEWKQGKWVELPPEDIRTDKDIENQKIVNEIKEIVSKDMIIGAEESYLRLKDKIEEVVGKDIKDL